MENRLIRLGVAHDPIWIACRSCGVGMVVVVVVVEAAGVTVSRVG